MLLLIWGVQIATTTLGDFDDRVVVIASYFVHEVVDSPRPYLQASFRQRTFRRHRGTESGVRIAAAGRVTLDLGAAEIASVQELLLARIGHNTACVVGEADPVQRRVKKLFVANPEAHHVKRWFAEQRF